MNFKEQRDGKYHVVTTRQGKFITEVEHGPVEFVTIDIDHDCVYAFTQHGITKTPVID